MNDYTNNVLQYQELENLIEKLVEKKVLSILDNLGVEATDYAIVSSIDSVEYDETETDVIKSVLKASVILPNGDEIRNMINGSGEILQIGDKVKIYGSRSNISNRYIGMRYTNSTDEVIT